MADKKNKGGDKSAMGYRDDSPYRFEPYIDINTPTGYIDMSNTGTPLKWETPDGRTGIFEPYSGEHFVGSTKVRERKVFQNGEDPEMLNWNNYNTPLTKKEEKKFLKWLEKESKRQKRNILMDMGSYDIQGFWKSGDYKKMDEDNHGFDTWKKPNHPTFSEQSKYVDETNRGGIWMEDGAFHPSAETAKLYGKEYYDWLFGVEPEHRKEHYAGALLPDVVASPKQNGGGIAAAADNIYPRARAGFEGYTKDNSLENYLTSLQGLENSVQAGFDKETGRWYPHKSIEGGSDTIAFGHKLQKGEDYSKGLSQEEALSLQKKDVEHAQKIAQERLDKKYGKGTFDRFLPEEKILATDYFYNLGPSALDKFPSFFKGLTGRDKDLMLKEYQRFSGSTPLKERNKWTEGVINTINYGHGGKVENIPTWNYPSSKNDIFRDTAEIPSTMRNTKQNGGPSYRDSDIYKNATPTQKRYLDWKYNEPQYIDVNTGQIIDPASENVKGAHFVSGQRAWDEYIGKLPKGQFSTGFKMTRFKDPETGKTVRIPADALNEKLVLGNPDIEMNLGGNYYEEGSFVNTPIEDSAEMTDGTETWGGVQQGLGYAAAAAGVVGDMASGDASEKNPEDYVDAVQSGVASAIPIAGLFHGISEMGTDIAASTAPAGEEERYATISERLFQPHTWITGDTDSLFAELGWTDASNTAQYSSEGQYYNPVMYNDPASIDEPRQQQMANLNNQMAEYGGNILGKGGYPVQYFQNGGGPFDPMQITSNEMYNALTPEQKYQVQMQRYNQNWSKPIRSSMTQLSPEEVQRWIKDNPSQQYEGVPSKIWKDDLNHYQIEYQKPTRQQIISANSSGNKAKFIPDPNKVPNVNLPNDMIDLGERGQLQYPTIYAGDKTYYPSDVKSIYESGKSNDPRFAPSRVSGDYRDTMGGTPVEGTTWNIVQPNAIHTKETFEFEAGGPLPVTDFNVGGSHEENAVGGIPQGTGSNGAVNLVREGERKTISTDNGQDFIVSDAITLDKETAEKYHIDKKFIGKDMVTIFDKLTRKKEGRESNDEITNNSIKLALEKFGLDTETGEVDKDASFFKIHSELTDAKNAEEAMAKKLAYESDMTQMQEKYPEQFAGMEIPEQAEFEALQNQAFEYGGYSNKMQNGTGAANKIRQVSKGGPHSFVSEVDTAGYAAGKESFPYKVDLNTTGLIGGSSPSIYSGELNRDQLDYFLKHRGDLQNAEDYFYAMGDRNRDEDFWKKHDRNLFTYKTDDGVFDNDIDINTGRNYKYPSMYNPSKFRTVPANNARGKSSRPARKEHGGFVNSFQPGGPMDEDISYRNRTYKVGVKDVPFRELSEAQQRFLDYKYGYSGTRNIDTGEIDYKRMSPGHDYSGETYEQRWSKDKVGNDKMTPFTDPETGKGWRVPADVLGKEYPPSVSLQNGDYLDNPFAQDNALENFARKKLYEEAGVEDFISDADKYVWMTDVMNAEDTRTKDSTTEDDEYGPKKYTHTRPLASYLEYAAPIYNLAMGLGMKEEKHDPSALYTPIKAPEMNIDEAIRQANRSFSGAARNLRAANPQGYKANIIGLYGRHMENIAKLNEQKENRDASLQFAADRANQQAEMRAKLTSKEWERMSKQEKRSYLDAAFTAASDIGQGIGQEEVGLTYANMMSPDFQLEKTNALKEMLKGNKGDKGKTEQQLKAEYDSGKLTKAEYEYMLSQI